MFLPKRHLFKINKCNSFNLHLKVMFCVEIKQDRVMWYLCLVPNANIVKIIYSSLKFYS